ncbi:hypothetical protein Tco_0209466 [Tanacetum coccineum]
MSHETLIHRYLSFTMDGSVEALRCLVSLKGLNGAAEVVGTEPHVLLGHMLEDLEMLRVRLPRLINMINHMTRKQPFTFKGMNTVGFNVSKHGTCAEQVVSLVDRVGIENTVNYHLKNEITRAELVRYIMRVKDQTTSLISDLEATIQNCFDRKNNVGYTHLEQVDLLDIKNNVKKWKFVIKDEVHDNDKDV